MAERLSNVVGLVRAVGIVAGVAGMVMACSTEKGDEIADGEHTDKSDDGAGAGVDADAGPEGGGESGEECSPLSPIPSRLWRLSMTQFSNSVRDLLGLDVGPVMSDTGGAAEYAFFSDTSGGVSGTLAFSLYQALLTALDDVRPRIAELAACVDDQPEDECAEDFAHRFGGRAFRRPLDSAEVSALLDVYEQGREQGFEVGIERMIEALLQSPSFLYRSELGAQAEDAGEGDLTPYEIATQLSYFLLDSTPDEELMAAAESGELSEPEVLEAHVERLLATEAVRENVNRIVADWFGVRQILSKSTKSTSLLSNLREADQVPSAIANELLTSARLFIDDVLWQSESPLNELVQSRHMFVNRRLATLYDLPFSGPVAEFVGVNFPAAEGRAGILTHPAVLWAVSDPEATSVVHRGLYVHNDILCLQPVPSPGDLLQQPDIKEALSQLTTEREKADYRAADPTCSGCHQQIDPYGLILEGFDPIGAHRTSADGEAVDPTGEFALSEALDGQITGAEAFAEGIVDDELFSTCATQKIISYAIGRTVAERDTCEVSQVHGDFTAAGGTIESLFREVAMAQFLRARMGDAP